MGTDQSDRWRARLTIGLIAVLPAVTAIVLVTAGVLQRGGEDGSGAGDPLSMVETIEVTDRSHVDGPVEYPQQPPVGGAHAAVWQNCGSYAQPVPDEQAVHSLEHGAIWIAYRPDLPADQVAVLQELTLGQPYVLVSPYPSLDTAVVASAWGARLPLERVDESLLGAFIEAYAQGPETPEPGAPCSSGTGVPDA